MSPSGVCNSSEIASAVDSMSGWSAAGGIGYSMGNKRPGDANDRAIPQETRRFLGVQRRGHDDDPEVLADRSAHLLQHRHGQVAVQGPLVKLVSRIASRRRRETDPRGVGE